MSNSYDPRLLSGVPEATKVQQQEGYDVRILDKPGEDAHPSHYPLRSSLNHDPPSDTTPRDGYGAGWVERGTQPTRRPFWKTRNGIILISLVTFIIVAAAVGGGVGGALGGKSHSTPVNTGGGSDGSGGGSDTDQGTTPQSSSIGMDEGFMTTGMPRAR